MWNNGDLVWLWEKNNQSKKDQEAIQSSTTPDPGYRWESDTINKFGLIQ